MNFKIFPEDSENKIIVELYDYEKTNSENKPARNNKPPHKKNFVKYNNRQNNQNFNEGNTGGPRFGPSQGHGDELIIPSSNQGQMQNMNSNMEGGNPRKQGNFIISLLILRWFIIT